MAHTIHKNYKTEYETPDSIFKPLDEEFGFGLDAAATEKNSKCNLHLGVEHNALQGDWISMQREALGEAGNVWLNPPYGRGIGRWVLRAYIESHDGLTVVCLLPSSTDTAWFHDWVLPYAEIRWIRGRVQFTINGEKMKGGNPGANFIAIYRGK